MPYFGLLVIVAALAACLPRPVDFEEALHWAGAATVRSAAERGEWNHVTHPLWNGQLLFPRLPFAPAISSLASPAPISGTESLSALLRSLAIGRLPSFFVTGMLIAIWLRRGKTSSRTSRAELCVLCVPFSFLFTRATPEPWAFAATLIAFQAGLPRWGMRGSRPWARVIVPLSVATLLTGPGVCAWFALAGVLSIVSCSSFATLSSPRARLRLGGLLVATLAPLLVFTAACLSLDALSPDVPSSHFGTLLVRRLLLQRDALWHESEGLTAGVWSVILLGMLPAALRLAALAGGSFRCLAKGALPRVRVARAASTLLAAIFYVTSFKAPGWDEGVWIVGTFLCLGFALLDAAPDPKISFPKLRLAMACVLSLCVQGIVLSRGREDTFARLNAVREAARVTSASTPESRTGGAALTTAGLYDPLVDVFLPNIRGGTRHFVVGDARAFAQGTRGVLIPGPRAWEEPPDPDAWGVDRCQDWGFVQRQSFGSHILCTPRAVPEN